MPYDDPDPTDPMTLHGVAVETEDDSAMIDMAECFVEEYLRSGFDADRVLGVFRTRGYAGPYLAFQSLGEDAIRQMIEAHLSLRHLPRTPPDGRADGTVSLPVLES